MRYSLTASELLLLSKIESHLSNASHELLPLEYHDYFLLDSLYYFLVSDYESLCHYKETYELYFPPFSYMSRLYYSNRVKFIRERLL